MNLRGAVVTLALGLTISCGPLFAAPSAAANAAFDAYVRTVESRLAWQHASAEQFLAFPVAGRLMELKAGPVIDRLTTPEVQGGLLHHWRATEFVPGARAAELERVLRDFRAYPSVFAPEVERADAAPSQAGHFEAALRMRQRHVFTVVMDARYDVTFGQLDAAHRYSISRSTEVREIASPGTRAERALPADEDHGFLWRQNTYWSYGERDGGLYVQVESVSLTRSIPAGLAWAAGPYIESIPRDSLEFTLQRIASALRKRSPA